MICRLSGELYRGLFAVWLVFLLGLTGCTRDAIRVYEAPKERMSKRIALPAGWEEVPGGGMRLSSYMVRGEGGKDAQVSVVPMGGVAGTEIANVNRWRKQLSLEDISEDDLPGYAQQVTISGQPGRMYEFSGTGPEGDSTRTLAALLRHADTVWFFKMMGDDELVRRQKDAFVKFMADYELSHEGHPHAAAALPTPGAGVASVPETSPHPSPSIATNWNVPATWKPVAPGLMVQAKYVIADGKANVTVSVLAGSGGEILPNVNRWRTEQLQLPPATEKDLETLAVPLELPDAKGILVDMRGPTQRMVAARVPRGSETWYFKLMGEASIVGAEKNAFIEFVKSAK